MWIWVRESSLSEIELLVRRRRMFVCVPAFAWECVCESLHLHKDTN